MQSLKVASDSAREDFAYVRADQLRKRSLVVAFDGTEVEVISIKPHATDRVVELRVAESVERYSLCQRVMIPPLEEDGQLRWCRAVDLSIGDLVGAPHFRLTCFFPANPNACK